MPEQHKIQTTNMVLLWAFFEPNNSQSLEQTICSLPYGAHSNIHKSHLCTKGKFVEPKPLVSIVDRKCVMEECLLSFICKPNLPILLTPKLMQLYKDVSQDQKV